MSAAALALEVTLMVVATVLAMLVIGAFARRVLGVRIGVVRIMLAGLLGLGAEVGFESRVVWGAPHYNPAFIPVQLGIILLVAAAFLVLAELAVPQGSVPRPDQWLPGLRRSAARSQRYAQLVRIAARDRLIPFKLNTEPTSSGRAERRRQAEALKTALEDAGGAFVKLGQMLSTRSDILPVEFTTELQTLQQRVPPVPWELVRPVLAAALSQPFGAVFSGIDEEPIAAASIGQVHLATLVSGEPVAVKVQRPGIVPLVERDADITRRVARRLTQSTSWGRQLGLDALAESLTASLQDELDYGLEASNIAAMEAAQERRDPSGRVRIPHCFVELSARQVLVMEYVRGTTLSDPSSVAGLAAATRTELATRLFRAVLSQIMDDGIFHSDLHPGNVMITPDSDLALLDFGSIGRLDSEVRGHLTDVLLAFSRGDARAFSDALLAFVELPDDLAEAPLRRQIGAFLSRHLGSGATLDPAAFTEVVSILTTNGLAVPAELAVAFRAIATLEGTLKVLEPDFDLVAEASSYAEQRINAAQQPTALAQSLGDELLAALPIVRRLPQRIDRITGSLADGRLSVHVRLLADPRDRSIVREFINLAAVTFLAGVFALVAAILLTSAAGPPITPTLTLYQLFGYLLVVVSGVLTLRVIFDVFRQRRR